MFEKMIVKTVGEQAHYEIWEKKEFNGQGEFEAELEQKVKTFAKEMAFNNQEYRENGESTQKENKKIYEHVLQGKFAECAFDQFLTAQGIQTPGVDFTLTDATNWQMADVTIGNVKILVKATREFGNLLLLEQAANVEANYDLVVFVRIKPRKTYEVTGFITQKDLVETIIEKQHLIPEGALLNGVLPMQAAHYYVQAGCLRSMTNFKNAFDKVSDQ
ncbi:MAG: hypothetical protein ACRC17_02760 [Culicoidibacterales bacterium]